NARRRFWWLTNMGRCAFDCGHLYPIERMKRATVRTSCCGLVCLAPKRTLPKKIVPVLPAIRAVAEMSWGEFESASLETGCACHPDQAEALLSFVTERP